MHRYNLQLITCLLASHLKKMDEEKVRRAFHALNNMIQENLSMIKQVLEQEEKNRKDIQELKLRLDNFEKPSPN